MTRLRILGLGIIFLLCVAAVIAAPAQTAFFTTLASFDGTDGAGPYAALAQASDQNFYGTTDGGGIYGHGTVFKINPTGLLTALYSFCAQGLCPDGWVPSGLVQASDGNFYRVTEYGGANFYYGTVFQITPAGVLTTLHSFDGTDGANPVGALMQAADGSFYGTTPNGGVNNNCIVDEYCGTVFRITPAGSLTTLYSFCAQHGCPDGANPVGALVQAADGNFYGMTGGGGTYGHGTVFKITPRGSLTTLHSFGGSDGTSPYGELVEATDGNFYGATVHGGGSSNCIAGCGTIFKITPTGALTTLHSFDGSDGENPFSGVMQATDGNFYGTTEAGGTYTNGTVFKITLSGTLTTLHSFDGLHGQSPYGGLIQATNGFFYGATWAGGAYGSGTVFRLGVVRTCPTCPRP